ncbi:MAG: hypothetical protein ACFFDK_06830 [Promethearchaeota archaeon]
MVKIKVIDGIPCIILSDGADEIDDNNKEHNIKSEHFSMLNDFTRIQRSKENDCMRDLLKDLKEKFKNKQNSLL